jgi:hypothetical protein
MDVALEKGDWEAVERYAAALEKFTETEPLPWSTFFVARARALMRHKRGDGHAGDLQKLLGEAEQIGLALAVPAISTALTA